MELHVELSCVTVEKEISPQREGKFHKVHIWTLQRACMECAVGKTNPIIMDTVGQTVEKSLWDIKGTAIIHLRAD
jgi:hypothetical protein